MKTYILLFIIAITFLYDGTVCSQFTKTQIEQLTAKGIYEALEPDNPFLYEKAKKITEAYVEKDYIYKICALFDYLYKKWNYSSDPGGMEYFEKAGVSVFTMSGDCDDYSILLVSMIKSLGGDGRIICVSGHAYPELYLGKDLSDEVPDLLMQRINNYYEEKGSRIRVRNLNYHTDYDRTSWLNLDYQERHPGGAFAEYSPDAEHLVIYSDGSYRLAYLNNE
jgi:transglutaminase-like putative cysteine protease